MNWALVRLWTGVIIGCVAFAAVCYWMDVLTTR